MSFLTIQMENENIPDNGQYAKLLIRKCNYIFIF